MNPACACHTNSKEKRACVRTVYNYGNPQSLRQPEGCPERAPGGYPCRVQGTFPQMAPGSQWRHRGTQINGDRQRRIRSALRSGEAQGTRRLAERAGTGISSGANPESGALIEQQRQQRRESERLILMMLHSQQRSTSRSNAVVGVLEIVLLGWSCFS
jgi:hypothetical protein